MRPRICRACAKSIRMFWAQLLALCHVAKLAISPISTRNKQWENGEMVEGGGAEAMDEYGRVMCVQKLKLIFTQLKINKGKRGKKFEKCRDVD